MKIVFFSLLLMINADSLQPDPNDLSAPVVITGGNIIKTQGGHVSVLHKKSKEDIPWQETKFPEALEQGDADEYQKYRLGDYYGNDVLLDETHREENEEREDNHPRIKVKTQYLLEMINQLKDYQAFLKQEKDEALMEKKFPFNPEDEDEELQKKVLEKEEQDKKEKEIIDLREKVLKLKEKINEQSKEYPSDELIELIEKERNEIREMIKQIKNIEDEPAPTQEELDQFIARQEDTLEGVEDRLKQLEEHKQLLKDEINDSRTAEEKKERLRIQLNILEEYFKDLLQAKFDKLKLITDEKKQQQLFEDIKKIRERIEDLEQEYHNFSENPSEIELNAETKNKENEVLNELEKIQSNENASQDQKDVAFELSKQLENKIQVMEEQEQLKEKILNEENIVEEEEEIEKIDETMLELSEKEDHEKVIEDAEEEREELIEKIEKKKNVTDKYDINYEGTNLKHKLDIKMNPMYESLQNVLDEKYANTKDYDSFFVTDDQLNIDEGTGMKQLKQVQIVLKDVQDTFDIIFLDIPETMSQIPDDTNEQLDVGLEMLDNTISFLNEFNIEHEKVNNNIQHIKEIVKGMIFTMEEIMDFYQLLDRFNEVKEATKVSINPSVINAKENFQNITGEFNEAVETMEEQFETLQKILKDQKINVDRIQAAIPEEAALNSEEHNYDKKRIEAMDLAISELPNILNTKVDVDSCLQKAQIQIGKINTLRREILDNFEVIEGETLKENEEKNMNEEEKEELEENGEEGDAEGEGVEQESKVAIAFISSIFLILFQ